jgi:hypothetical protein
VFVNVAVPQVDADAADVSGLPIVVEAGAAAGATSAAVASAITGPGSRIARAIGALPGGLK